MKTFKSFLLVFVLIFSISANSFSSSPNLQFVNLNLTFTPLEWGGISSEECNKDGGISNFAVRQYATFLEIENYSSVPYELYILNSRNQTVFYKPCTSVVDCAQVSLEGFKSGSYSLYIFTDWGYWVSTFEV